MIQFKRGTTDNWKKEKTPLAAGQPGYDKDRNKLKIGNGKDTWDKLPDASGLRMDEILESEENAKKKAAAKGILNPLGALLAKAFKKEDRPVITYGTETPDDETLGQIYLQHYDTEPEVDYIIESGISDRWTYQIWKSGNIDCWCTYNLKTSIEEPLTGSNLFYNKETFDAILYPTQFKFKNRPHETVTLIGNGWLTWLASLKPNTLEQSGIYHIISNQTIEQAEYYITFVLHGKRDLTTEESKK